MENEVPGKAEKRLKRVSLRHRDDEARVSQDREWLGLERTRRVENLYDIFIPDAQGLPSRWWLFQHSGDDKYLSAAFH